MARQKANRTNWTQAKPFRRFLAFSYDATYPSGGFGDFVSDHDDLQEALATSLRPGREYGCVVDLQTGDEHDAKI